MSSLKQLIVNAIIKVSSSNPAADREGEPTAEEARDMFIAALVAELFPEDTATVEIPVAAPAPAPKAAKAPKAPKEPKSPKKSPEDKAAEKKAKEEAKAAEKAAKDAAKEAEKKAKEEAKEAEKKAKEEAKEAAKKAKEEAKAAKEVPALPASPKKAKKPKAEKPAADANLPKIDPTWRKALKEADKEHAKELEPALLAYVNALSNVAFNDKGAKEHVADFLASRAPTETPASDAASGAIPTDLQVVEFNGKEYYVNPETKRVYEGVLNEAGELTVTRAVGYVGMMEFADMSLA